MPTDRTPDSSPASPPWDGHDDDDPEIARVLAVLESRMLGVAENAQTLEADEQSTAPITRASPNT